MNSYCGKNCIECDRKEELSCNGCKPWQNSCSSECEIAECCKSKNHDTCETCNNNLCSLLNRKYGVPDTIIKRCNQEKAEKQRLSRNATILGKWMWLMFWLIVPQAVAAILSADVFGSRIVPNVIGNIISSVCTVLYGMFLIKASAADKDYCLAGWIRIIAGVITGIQGIITLYIGVGNYVLLISIPLAVLSFIGMKREYNTHAEVLYKINRELSEKWSKLWQLYLTSIILMLGGVILMLIVPLFGLLAMLLGLVFVVVISIKQLIYLYKSAKVFKEFDNK